MTSLHHLYRDFSEIGEGPDGTGQSPSSQDKLENASLEAFENGYSAGWEDALKAQNGNQTAAVEQFLTSLQSVSFGFHEARAGLVKAMQPVFSDIVSMFLPQAAQATLGIHVIEQLTTMIRAAADQPIQIEATSVNLETLDKILEDGVPEPFTCIPNDELGPNQIFLKVGSEERELNFDTVIEGVSSSMNAFVQQMQKENTHE